MLGSGSSPTRGRPSSTAVIAGTAPSASIALHAAFERLGVGRRRQPEVGEDRRLQRDDTSTAGQRVGDGGSDHRLDHERQSLRPA